MNKPAAVKVAEKVIADMAGLPDGPTVSDIPPHHPSTTARHLVDEGRQQRATR